MKLGARILKTGIAITLALLAADWFNLPSPVFAGIAAIFAIQPTIYRSYLTIIEQIQGNLIGALTAVIFVLLFGNHYLIVGFAAILVITLAVKLKIEKTVGLTLVTLIAIMESPSQDFIQFAFNRFSTVMLGVFAAFIVNLIFLPPKYETKLYYRISSVTEETLKWIRLNTRNASEHRLLKKDIEKIRTKLSGIDQLYLLYKEERAYFKKNKLAKIRKLVVYRQMIVSGRRSFDILRRLHRYENEIHQLPEELQKIIQSQLDCLMSHHEQLLLMFVGKVKPHLEEEMVQSVCSNRAELIELYKIELNQDSIDSNFQPFHLMHILSSILEYDEHLEHLEKMIYSFKTHHVDENQLSISDPVDE